MLSCYNHLMIIIQSSIIVYHLVIILWSSYDQLTFYHVAIILWTSYEKACMGWTIALDPSFLRICVFCRSCVRDTIIWNFFNRNFIFFVKAWIPGKRVATPSTLMKLEKCETDREGVIRHFFHFFFVLLLPQSGKRQSLFFRLVIVA